MQIPIDPATTTKMFDQPNYFPPNIAEQIPESTLRWIFEKYVWPQIWERRQFEPLWDRLNDMYRINCPVDVSGYKKSNRTTNVTPAPEESDRARISDTIIFDTVDRLKNLSQFIAWKPGRPVRYDKPEFYNTSSEDAFYSPTARKIQAANALLDWDLKFHDVSQKSLTLWQHYYLYGIAFVHSDFEFQVQQSLQRTAEGGRVPSWSITKLGTTFDPISIRRLWINWRISSIDFDKQTCPFFFTPTPRFEIVGNIYHPMHNPFGYTNLERIRTENWYYTQETESWRKGLEAAIPDGGSNINILQPEFSVEANWKLFPMLQLNPETFEIDPTQPFKRWHVEIFGQHLSHGQLIPIRFAECHLPKNRLPIYASSHIPDLDSGAYSPSTAELLENHYRELVIAKEQYIENKDWINNPPSWYMQGSPSSNADINKPGVKIEVLGPNDFGWRTPYDATGTTVAFVGMTRDSAQTTGKAVDAILGKALGGRTSATEASNVFQAAMSGVTTDINCHTTAIYGGYARRSWENAGYFMDQDMIRHITGQNGSAPLSLVDLNIEIGIVTSTGTDYIESILKQQNIQYVIQATQNNPAVDQGVLLSALLDAMNLPEAKAAIIDNARTRQIELATLQSANTYLGIPIAISPMQDHASAMEVKTRFLEDVGSTWNTTYGGLPSATNPQLARSQDLANQISIHQQFLLVQQQQQLLQQQVQMAEMQSAEMQMKSKPTI